MIPKTKKGRMNVYWIEYRAELPSKDFRELVREAKVKDWKGSVYSNNLTRGITYRQDFANFSLNVVREVLPWNDSKEFYVEIKSKISPFSDVLRGDRAEELFNYVDARNYRQTLVSALSRKTKSGTGTGRAPLVA